MKVMDMGSAMAKSSLMAVCLMDNLGCESMLGLRHFNAVRQSARSFFSV